MSLWKVKIFHYEHFVGCIFEQLQILVKRSEKPFQLSLELLFVFPFFSLFLLRYMCYSGLCLNSKYFWSSKFPTIVLLITYKYYRLRNFPIWFWVSWVFCCSSLKERLKVRYRSTADTTPDLFCSIIGIVCS